MRRKWTTMAVFLSVLLGMCTWGQAAPIAPWSTVGQLPSGSETATVKFALVNVNGNLVKGVTGNAFTLYDVAAGTKSPGKFQITVKENSSLQGIYTMTITPSGSWSSKFYVFKFLVRAGTTVGPGMVTLANVGELWPTSAPLSQDEKEQILEAIPLE